jgi:hypothetical protein
MIEAYLDESGIHDGAKVCVVGGYYGSQAAWRKFEKEWNKIIASYPELQNRGFHAKEFFRRENGKRVGVYADWDDDKARKFLDRLVQAIMRNRIFPIGYAIVVQDFLDLPLPDRKWLTGAKFTLGGKCVTSGCPRKSYYVPFQFCVLDSARMSGATQIDKIHFFAGLDRSFHEYASSLYNYLFNDVRLQASIQDLLGGIHYPLAKDTPGIQGADLLVYRLYRFAQEKLEAKKNLPNPPLLAKLIKNRKPEQRFTLFNSELIRKMQEGGKQAYERLAQNGQLPEYLSNLRKS